MKKPIKYLCMLVLISMISACSGITSASTVFNVAASTEQAGGEQAAATATGETTGVSAGAEIAVEYDADDFQADADRPGMTDIDLGGNTITVEGSGAEVDGSDVTITSAGSYRISGTLDDGQVIVDSQDEQTVFLLLDGAVIHSSSRAPIYVLDAEKTVITLVDGTENAISDGDSYIYADGEDEPDAALFSNDDLTINGTGSLFVEANHGHGIASDDDLKIVSGTLIVTAADDGIRASGSLAIREGVITVEAGADGLQALNDEEAGKGTVTIEGGQIVLTAGLDGIQAATRLAVSGGEIRVTSGGGAPDTIVTFEQGFGAPAVASDSTESTKGLKAGVDLTITGGTIFVDASDDALHSNDVMTIAGGELELATGDDGLHADTNLTILGGDLSITRSYEGIESSQIQIAGGTIHVVASDDGVNASDGTGSGGVAGFGPGFVETGDQSLTVRGGYLVVDALGDGIDINGPIEMTGGTVLVMGPTANNNGALDYSGSFQVSGGLLVAVGSAGMPQAPSEASTQNSLMHNFIAVQPAGTVLHLENEDGEEVLTFQPWREYVSVVVSSAELGDGGSYTLYTGGSASGTAVNGLYPDGSYTPGEEVVTFTIASSLTSTGAEARGFGPGPGGGRPPRP